MDAVSTMDTIYNGRRLQWTLSAMDAVYNGHHLQWTQSTTGDVYNGRDLQWTLSTMDAVYQYHSVCFSAAAHLSECERDDVEDVLRLPFNVPHAQHPGPIRVCSRRARDLWRPSTSSIARGQGTGDEGQGDAQMDRDHINRQNKLVPLQYCHALGATTVFFTDSMIPGYHLQYITLQTDDASLLHRSTPCRCRAKMELEFFHDNAYLVYICIPVAIVILSSYT